MYLPGTLCAFCAFVHAFCGLCTIFVQPFFRVTRDKANDKNMQ